VTIREPERNKRLQIGRQSGRAGNFSLSHPSRS
jgi:hypothetical protein